MGLTGVITEATLRLVPIETSRMVVDTVKTADLDSCMAFMSEQDAAHRYSVAWVDSLARGRNLGRSLITMGDHARAEDDLVLSRDGATVLIDPVSVQFMTGAEIDFVDDLIGASFKINNPVATSSCGCGTSFSL